MPTKSDFEAAAADFDEASRQIAEFAAIADGAGVSNVIRGGSLGRQITDRITSSGATAHGCSALSAVAAATCRERVAIIDEYEARLFAYDRANYYYEQSSTQWGARYNAWFLDETGLIPNPGSGPRPPTKPVPPPAWADVRRP